MNALQRDRLTDKLVILVWVMGLIIIWEMGATVVEHTKRTPANVLPHLHQIVQSVFSKDMVSNNQTALQIVLSNTGITLLRAGIGFVIGVLLVFFWPCL
jgi:ABC-type nitrate/sulfonate/bicarbonate transport system permease component